MRIQTIILRSEDLHASTRFWIELFGFSQVSTFDQQVELSDGAVTLLLDCASDHSGTIELIVAADAAQFSELAAAVDRDWSSTWIRRPRDWGGPLGLELAVRDPTGHCITVHVQSAAPTTAPEVQR